MTIEKNIHINNLLLKGKIEYESHHFSSAQSIFEEVLNLNSNEVNALNFLGLIHLQTQQYELSEQYFELAIKNDATHAIIFNNYGNLLKEKKQWSDAISIYKKALQLDPLSGEIHSNLGLVFHESGNYSEAISSYEGAINLKPDYFPAYYNLANTLKVIGELENALLIYDFVLSKDPKHFDVLNNRALTLKDLGRFDEALRSITLAIEAKPNSHEAYLNLGNIYFDLAYFDLAINAYDRALNIEPNYPDALTNRGNIHYCLKDFDKALLDHEQALMINPTLPNANWNKSLTLLMCGNYLRGWEMYEWRHEINKKHFGYAPRPFEAPLWLGQESLINKTIFIHAEQGLGDTLQFCRLIPRIHSMGANVIFEVQRGLESLLSCLSPYATIVSQGTYKESYDFHIPLLSIPYALKIELNMLPLERGYLKAPLHKIDFWKKRLNEYKKFRIGLVWSGGYRPNQPEVRSVHQRRNIPLSEFKKFHVPGTQIFSLQKGEPAESELSQLIDQDWDGPNIISFTNEFHDFSDTAAFIENLDLVISVDTSTAHLAGAMGKPVWLLNRYDTCWRWMCDKEETHWYPTMKIYRQVEINKWNQVICRVAQDLFLMV